MPISASCRSRIPPRARSTTRSTVPDFAAEDLRRGRAAHPPVPDGHAWTDWSRSRASAASAVAGAVPPGWLQRAPAGRAERGGHQQCRGGAPRARRGRHRGHRRRDGSRGLRPRQCWPRDRGPARQHHALPGRRAQAVRPSGATRPRCWSRRQDRGPGALHRLLEPLAKHKVSMTRIESRPSRKRKWDYVFFIDVEGHVEEPPCGHGAGRAARPPGVAVPCARLLSESDSLSGLRIHPGG
jgi:hypothetical protein